MRRIHLAALTVAALLVSAAIATADSYTVSALVQEDIARVSAATDVPVRLPTELNLDYDGAVYSDASASRSRYEFDLNATEECGANACFLAQLSGQRGGSLAFRRRIALAGGITGRFKPLSCGASCSPPTIEWKQNGFLYRIQAKTGAPKPRRAMRRAANQAIRSTPR